MTEPAITEAHYPAALLRVVNPIVRLLLRTPFKGMARKQLMVLSFTGRKTGRPYAIPFTAHRIDNALYALTNGRWKHNFREGAPARVLHAGKTTTVRGELIEDRAIVADLYRRSLESYGTRFPQRTMGLKFRDQQIPAPEDFADAVGRLSLAAIRLTPDA
ncbi:MAG: hypothetical protein JOZ00_22050 [Mycobacterium sp.]|uniref:hypothetical protein n=1 Tax=Mycobacterium sp. TaxID=1785 RepID=UPI001ED07928|nr:hypothetical protein [Mycobacterium sp.]MBV8789348.1 hypothetical protein [Mycobacterium sp.]